MAEMPQIVNVKLTPKQDLRNGKRFDLFLLLLPEKEKPRFLGRGVRVIVGYSAVALRMALFTELAIMFSKSKVSLFLIDLGKYFLAIPNSS